MSLGSGEGALLGYRLPTSDSVSPWFKGTKELWGGSFISALIPFRRAP